MSRPELGLVVCIILSLFLSLVLCQVCREAVVRIAHEKAQELDKAGVAGVREEIDLTARLRPVTMDDFWEARKKVCLYTYVWSGEGAGNCVV